ncbi:MAG: peptidylprolyl isomerase [Bacteroidota bacterium]|nr:peptidylprolyl isomerase [Bacteroidota bacterium]MDP4204728.1 peptidylprolyl isomerase [Bacteroidota bacterium]
MVSRKIFGILIIALIFISFQKKSQAQDKVADQVVAVVGNNIILKSDIEALYQDYQARGATATGDAKCEILEKLLVDKLMLAEAQRDTTINVVTDSEINQQMDSRIQNFVQYLGSEKEVEKYFKKSIIKIKADMRDMVLSYILTKKMESKITEKIATTPSEVKYYYNNLPEDQKPTVNTQMEYAQILIKPGVTDAEDLRVKNQLRELKKRVENGESFSVLATLYSEDGSAKNGGELGYMPRSGLDPAFANAAFNLKGNKVSSIVKSEYGYHIIQVIDRKGDKINCRHILIKPKVDQKQVDLAMKNLDTLVVKINKGTFKFEDAAFHVSQDKNSRNNGGLVFAQTQEGLKSKFFLEELNADDSRVLKDLKLNEISKPFVSEEAGQTQVKIVRLLNRIDSHKANLKDDYDAIRKKYEEKKRQDIIDQWVKKQQIGTYVRIDDSYANCNFKYKWTK